jgi:predicted nucleotidyltransferase
MVPWTGIDELDRVLAELVTNAQHVFGEDLVGVYLQGSFALGGADNESDCDFLVVTATPVDLARLARLGTFFSQLLHRPGYWNQHLNGSYPLAADLADLSALGRPWPYVDHGSDQVILDPHCNSEVTRWVLYQHGVTLHGPSPRTFLQPVPEQMMRVAAWRDLRQAVDRWQRHHTWDAWSQRYAVLTMPRLLRTQVFGDVVSKPAAVAWALEVLDPRWRPLLTTALAERGQRPWDAPIDVDLARRTEEFVQYVGRVAEQTQPPNADPAAGPPRQQR